MRQQHKVLGSFLREARINSKLSQHFVAKKLGYRSPQFVSNYERGLCSPPIGKMKTLVMLYDLNPLEVIDLIQRVNRLELEKKLLNNKGKRFLKVA